MKETDEDEALQATANRGQSVAAAGNFAHRGKMRVWERSDMDGVATWSIGKGEEEEVEVGQTNFLGARADAVQLQDQVEWPGEEFKFRSFNPPSSRPSTVQTAEEERTSKIQGVTSDDLIDVVPSLGIGKRGGPMTAVGTNEYASVSSRLSQLKRASGNIVLLHQTAASLSQYQPSAYFLTSPSRGHADVVRSLYHDVANEAIYTGSEDGVLCGWSLAGLPRLVVGDPEVDDDGGDGRDDVASDDEGDEESEIEMESEDGDMDVDEEEEEEGPRYGPVIGGGRNGDNRKDKRWDKRPHPY